MPTKTLNTLTIPSGYALQVNASPEVPLTLFNKTGSGTFYYSSERVVSSASNEGSVAVEASVTINQPTFVISASTSYVEVRQETPAEVTGVYAGGWPPVAATSGTDTTPAEKKLYLTSLHLGAAKKIKTITYLVGSVGGTNKVVACLADASGNILARSSETTEGATVGTAAEIQELALTVPYSAFGPGLYFVGITMNGNTARYRSIPKNTASNNVLSGEVSLTTKNVIAAFTPPTTFTADKGPIAWVN